ncbi:MAG: hypothetical protein KGH64_03330 [Candidatus Micrarchaeota archaeon]|nr:hypothetical protein [Candidatus Micrarchaeota archaeon]MDE1834345.1 hypothetical protein [Candidatus Micrarchaeota archaeon]MDE1860031.1 hypothetical protein [Candidatus Micrarchaeota archaeon]
MKVSKPSDNKINKSSRQTTKLQSAMEYLTTYGWALLIIAVVLVALLLSGVLNTSTQSITSCVAAYGYQCSNISYSHATGNVTLTVEQVGGAGWTSANVYFVPQGTPEADGVPIIITIPAPATANVIKSGLPRFVPRTVTLGVSGPVKLGVVQFGNLWVDYTTNSSNTHYYFQFATITLKAV